MFITWLGDLVTQSRKENTEFRRVIADLSNHIAQKERVISINEPEIIRLTASVAELAERNEVIDIENSRLQTEVYGLQHSLQLAENRVDDLKETIKIERDRFDKAIEHDRELNQGIRAKIGLIPQERKEGENKPGPVVAGRVPWRNTQQDLQKRSKEQVARTEEHWKKKIAEVEHQDAERARTADSGGKTD